MKRILLVCLLAVLFFSLVACTSHKEVALDSDKNTDIMPTEFECGEISMNKNTFCISANGTTFSAVFADNSSAEAFRELLSGGDITVSAHDYGSFEKVGVLGTTLPRNDEQITTVPGDVILYQGSQITVYYDQNSWSFTRLGKIENASKESLLNAFGEGDVEITFSLAVPGSAAPFDLTSGKNGRAPTVMLNNGYEMPILGLGTYSLHGDTVKNSVTAALNQGVRLIDTAYMYGNEKEIGEAIRASDVPREEIFVITKIYPGEQFQNPKKAIQDVLDKLDIGYINIMLLHHPGDNDMNAYHTMEKFALSVFPTGISKK